MAFLQEAPQPLIREPAIVGAPDPRFDDWDDRLWAQAMQEFGKFFRAVPYFIVGLFPVLILSAAAGGLDPGSIIPSIVLMVTVILLLLVIVPAIVLGLGLLLLVAGYRILSVVAGIGALIFGRVPPHDLEINAKAESDGERGDLWDRWLDST